MRKNLDKLPVLAGLIVTFTVMNVGAVETPNPPFTAFNVTWMAGTLISALLFIHFGMRAIKEWEI
jgi:membrane protein DedA with SNARE-associated domain